ncbi:hypothetical protein H6G81_26535 [Scytonema hofmannii FACHB-248]|uniref:Uncharacterized protein n=1 Tax=Scytonema hofmannii FACHB-248 TaxID=1842502 RepID=A0ABR8GWS1_9CYAN|nr:MULTISPECIES: hypothetical protein [Nostocales]MBD2607976.1 hypothetical protein [Scytonema hofmannii FACHB-248]
METPENLDLIWEKAVGGYVGIYKAQKKVIFTPTLMKNLAISKMMDVRLISADFKGSPVVFTPLFWLLLDSISNIEFFGVYSNNDEDFSDNSNNLDISPPFCIRKALWSKSEDIYNFQNADDKKKYILGENQVISNVFFIDSTHVPEITQLISEVIKITKNGLILQENLQNKLVYDEIKINVSDGRFYLNFSYKPHLLTNSALEEWIIKLCNCIDSLPLDIGYLPDGKFRMSYELSLFDKVSMFDRF